MAERIRLQTIGSKG